MIRSVSALPALLLLLPAPLAAQAVRDFQLPPGATPSPDTSVQGPVDTDAPVPVRPRPIETARPEPAPTQSGRPAVTLPPAATAPVTAPVQPRVQPTPVPTRTNEDVSEQSPQAQSAADAPTPAAALETPAAPGATSFPIAETPSSQPTPALAEAGKDAPAPWLWVMLGALVLAAAGAGVFFRRRRSAPPPEITVPRVVAAADSGEALAIAVEAVRLDRSVMNATVNYRVTIRNRTQQALGNVAVESDLVSASRERPPELQLASPDRALTPRHAAERLAPGQSLRFEGQARLPLAEVNAIWQGRVGLLVPLLRFRATADGASAVATTLVIGRSEGQATRPQPFRLDEPPRSYAPLAQRVLDGVPAQA